jgi:hypothetical protein
MSYIYFLRYIPAWTRLIRHPTPSSHLIFKTTRCILYTCVKISCCVSNICAVILCVNQTFLNVWGDLIILYCLCIKLYHTPLIYIIKIIMIMKTKTSPKSRMCIKNCKCPHSADEETKAQRGWETDQIRKWQSWNSNPCLSTFVFFQSLHS